ncbi:15-hydroxyprostaglandin dehydrogenase [NAD(+)] isoform X2 [Gambusia affinis]|uniref:15-hydroxyprostaglandin dehydrogenase [NAD(+)] isoform X2 n=1 Tax=Gambusia affinis TaxID=33528 RepID=UPI001CDD68B6|nr:15-hydroxyprostaglandin dehydrogenase [NAD(+)] isoform X2 [Gambusia affinis]
MLFTLRGGDPERSRKKKAIPDTLKTPQERPDLVKSCTLFTDSHSIIRENQDLVAVLGAAFKKTVETFGGIDILCNNAGILNETSWEKTISINLMSVIRGTYVALEQMNRLSGGRGGVIINTASMAGIGPFLSCPSYTASKFGVVGFTRAMAAASEASGYGVRFNAVCPGFVQTDLMTNIPVRLGQFSNLAAATHKLVDVMGTIAVSDVAAAALELLTDDTKNGEALLVLQSGATYMQFPSFNPTQNKPL